MAQFEIEYTDTARGQDRIELYRINFESDPMIDEEKVSLIDLWRMALEHANKNTMYSEYIARIEFIAW